MRAKSVSYQFLHHGMAPNLRSKMKPVMELHSQGLCGWVCTLYHSGLTVNNCFHEYWWFFNQMCMAACPSRQPLTFLFNPFRHCNVAWNTTCLPLSLMCDCKGLSFHTSSNETTLSSIGTSLPISSQLSFWYGPPVRTTMVVFVTSTGVDIDST